MIANTRYKTARHTPRPRRLWSVVLILLAYVGQLAASSNMHCLMGMSASSNPSGEAVIQMARMSHDQMSHSQMSHSQMSHGLAHSSESHSTMSHHAMSSSIQTNSKPVKSCCSIENDCSVGCSVSALTTVELMNHHSLEHTQSIVHISNLLLNQPLTNPFRPPIFA